MTDRRVPTTGSGFFQPTWGHALFAFVLATVGFCLPQEVPLEWYPLNEPGTDINYLEITCAANITNETQLYLDYGRGFNELDSIRIPISPSKQVYTYTFPLRDAPMIGLRVDPCKASGELLITNLRIINRHNEEIRRFVREDFYPTHQIAAIAPTEDGWKIITTPNATDPYSEVSVLAPLTPVGMNHRNLLRCLLSTGYLSAMLLILLCAALFTFHRAKSWCDLFSRLGFMACLAIFFSAVGNRGLVRNSVHYFRYLPPSLASGLSLEFDLRSDRAGTAQLFYDTGSGYGESESLRQTYTNGTLQTLRYPLPSMPLRALRFDPCDNEGSLDILHIRVVDAGRRTRLVLPLHSLHAAREIVDIKIKNAQLHVQTQHDGEDPITIFTPEATSAINQAYAQAKAAKQN